MSPPPPSKTRKHNFLTWNELSLRHKPFGFLVEKLGKQRQSDTADQKVNKILEIIHKGSLTHAVSANKFRHSQFPLYQKQALQKEVSSLLHRNQNTLQARSFSRKMKADNSQDLRKFNRVSRSSFSTGIYSPRSNKTCAAAK